MVKLIILLGLIHSFAACSKKSKSKTDENPAVAGEPVSVVETVASSAGGVIDPSGYGSEAPNSPAPFSAVIVSDQGEIKVTSELTCEGTTSNSQNTALTYERIWLEANSVDGPWHAYSGLTSDSGKIVLTSAHAHKFIKCRIRAIDENGLATIASTAGAQVRDSAPVAQSIAFSTEEDAPLVVSISLGSGYADEDLDGLTSVTSAQLLGGSLSSWTCSGGACTNIFTPNLNFIGKGTFEYTVSTSYSSSSNTGMATFDIVAVNDAPTILAIGDQVVLEDHSLSLPIFISDVDNNLECGSSLIYSSNQPEKIAPVGGVVFSGTWPNCSANISPKLNAFGSVTLTFAVSDGSLTSSQNFNLSITPVNDLPFISKIVSQSTSEDVNISGISFSIVDLDSNLSCSSSVTAASSNSTLLPLSSIQMTGEAPNCVLNLAPEPNQFGTAVITLTLTDDLSGAASDWFTLAVSSVNDSPTFSGGVAIVSPLGLQVTKTISCSGMGVDVEGDPLTYVNSFQVATSDTGPWLNAAGTVDGSGSLVIEVGDAHKFLRCKRSVSDGKGGSTQEDSPEVVVLDSDVMANDLFTEGLEDTTIALTIASGMGLGYLDDDGDLATGVSVDLLSSGILDGDFVCNTSGDCTVNYTPAANFNGSATFIFTVYTAYGSSDPKLFTINISPVNDAPILVGTSNIPIEKSHPYSLAMNASDDDGDVLTASCQAQCPAGISFAGTTLNWTPVDAEIGSRTLVIRVTDSSGLFSEGSFSFTVVDTIPPQPPTLTSMAVIPPANSLIFNLNGHSETNTTLKIFKSSNCAIAFKKMFFA